MSRAADVGRFVSEFARDPLHTAAVAPSSPALAAAMVEPLTTSDPLVVELGPGTGAFTTALQVRTGGRGRHLAIELNERWARLLESRHPDVEVVVADAMDLPAVLAERGLGAVDAVVSGLPWAAHRTGPDGRRLPEIVAGVLAPTGFLTQFAYTWSRWAAPARRQLADLRSSFADVVITPTVWRNVPPAVVYQARRPTPRK
jgi:phosphatidylethanolamine/phosphatidyl-N-methylethanolamine N-methyltransferase